VAQQWAWVFVHGGPDRKLGTADDIVTVDELHVQVDRVYQFELMSKDVLHSFSVPVFRLKQDAVPGRTIRGWFKPTQRGRFDIQCAEICGIGHGLMPGAIVIESTEEHQAWLRAQST
jgi:cytochrome c oxidase subunit 2